MGNPNYFGIITAPIRYSKTLTDFQKILYSDIVALSNRYGYCTASNDYFGNLFDKAPETISRSISALQKEGHLKVVMVYDKEKPRLIIGRRIYPVTKFDEDNPLDEKYRTEEQVPQHRKKKKAEQVEIPAWIDREIWSLWESHRAEKGQKLTPTSIKQQIKLLEANKPLYRDIIIQSIRNGWTGLFPIKPNAGIINKPEEGSIGWHMQNEERNSDTIDAEIE